MFSLQLFFVCGLVMLTGTASTYSRSLAAPSPAAITEWSPEEEAMIRIFQIWNSSNPGLSDDFPGRWSMERKPCDGWNGVECYSVLLNVSTSKRFIVSLTWESFGLIGTLPLEITELINIVTLNVASNERLGGPIPRKIWDLPKLNHVDLSHNYFTGELQYQQIHQRQPNHIDLSYNNFTGRFNVDYIQDIEYLDVSNNFFSGPVHFRALDERPAIWKVESINLSNNNFFGNFSTRNMAVVTMDLSNNSFSGFGPLLNTSIKTLIVSRNSLSGEFPIEVYQIKNLQYMDLDYNNYNGTFYLPELKNKTTEFLGYFSVTHNNFSSIELPDSYYKLNQTWLLPTYLRFAETVIGFQGNPVCDNPKTDLAKSACHTIDYSMQAPPPVVIVLPGPGAKWQIIIIIVVCMLLVVIVVFMIFAITIRRLLKKIMALRAIEQELAKKEVKPYLYSYNELKSATQNFSQDNILGKGGFGTVYKGVLPEGTVVAVKHLYMSKQVLHEFLNEIVLITGIRHRNLVKLKGCCLREEQRLLVYEFVENRNLAEALWSTNGPSDSGPHRLDWPTRFSIILGIAQGLTCLHEDVQPPIIHRDIKAPNILLDRDLKPKIADFGLALLFPPLEDGQTHLSSIEIAGTRGYMSPEYASFGQVTAKVDVFSFGVLVLEIVSGRKNVDMDKPSEQRYLLGWVWKLHELEGFHELVDKQLTKDHEQSMEEIIRVVSVGLLCVQYLVARRPRMSDVVAMLQGRLPIQEIPRNYELNNYGDVETSNPPTSTGLTTSTLGEIQECLEEESSLLMAIQPIAGTI